ncbi:MAG TPA: GAF domain-containing protein [Methylomirabilota bacterium]|nr:GAF domain-containing protein [Methylomirabilota bacterium]
MPRRRPPALDAPAEVARLSSALAAAPDMAHGLEDLLATARRLTGAEAGTIYLRRGELLEFTVVQNDVLARRLGTDEVRRRLASRPLSLRETSVASYVVVTRATVNLRDAYAIPRDRPYTLFREIDRKADYRTRSMLATPLRDGQGRVFGVLQLINARGARGRIGSFSKEHQTLVQALAAQAPALPVA